MSSTTPPNRTTHRPDASHILLAARLEDRNIKPMPDAVRRRRHARDARTYDRDLWPAKVRLGSRWCRGKDCIDTDLPDVVHKEERVLEGEDEVRPEAVVFRHDRRLSSLSRSSHASESD